MAKKPHYSFSKKYLPEGSHRVTKEDGTRVLIVQGREYLHKRDYFEKLSAAVEKAKQAAAAKADQPAVETAMQEPEAEI